MRLRSSGRGGEESHNVVAGQTEEQGVGRGRTDGGCEERTHISCPSFVSARGGDGVRVSALFPAEAGWEQEKTPT